MDVDYRMQQVAEIDGLRRAIVRYRSRNEELLQEVRLLRAENNKLSKEASNHVPPEMYEALHVLQEEVRHMRQVLLQTRATGHKGC